MILRTLERKLIDLAKKFPVISLTGPRQSGKTTLVRQAFPDYAYVSLEEPDTRLYAQSDPRAFLNNHAGGLIIDEVQRVPELFSYIQSIVDASDTTGHFILTGSQNFLLLEKISQSLAGRVAILKLLPFSLDELNLANFDFPRFEPVLLQGFYPRIFDKNIAPEDYYPSYIQTYLERDVRQIRNITDLNAFTHFLKLCAGRIGQLVNLSALGQEAGVNHTTAKAWISLLEASYVLFLLQPHHRNFNKRLVKSPKLYFFDTGLVCSLLGITQSKQLETHYLRGSLFENMVIADICKTFTNKGQEPPLTFWRDKTGHEIDLLVESGGKLHPIEIKSGQTISKDFFKDLKYYNDLSGQKEARSSLIYGGDNNQIWNDIRVRSWKKTDPLD
jgi:predicted AAA+ superfamily ATPase